MTRVNSDNGIIGIEDATRNYPDIIIVVVTFSVATICGERILGLLLCEKSVMYVM